MQSVILMKTKLIIASCILYSYPEKNNVEMGVLIDYKNDSNAFEKANQEVHCIIKSSKLISLTKLNQSVPKAHSKNIVETPKNPKIESNNGHCISCNTKIRYDTKRPFCGECYEEWDGDSDYYEDYCHCCGKEDDTSKEYPECRSCYTSHKQESKRTWRTG